MYENFKILNFWKTRQKLKKLESLITRMKSDVIIDSNKIDYLINSFNILNKTFDNVQHQSMTNIPYPLVPPLSPSQYPPIIPIPPVENTYIYCDCKDNNGNNVLANIYDGSTLIGNSNSLIAVTAGIHIIRAEYDGKIIQHTVTVNSGETLILYFIFDGTMNTEIIVHGYNPEGKEINNIYLHNNQVQVLENDSFIGFAGNTPIIVGEGSHELACRFNGMITSNQVINIISGETYILDFEFTRTRYYDLDTFIKANIPPIDPDLGYGYIELPLPVASTSGFNYWNIQAYCSIGGIRVGLLWVNPEDFIYGPSIILNPGTFYNTFLRTTVNVPTMYIENVGMDSTLKFRMANVPYDLEDL